MNILLSPNIGQIAAQVNVILMHDEDAAVVGIRAQTPGHWPDSLTVKDKEFALAWCPSPIAIREKLLERETTGKGVVILTPMDDQNLGADVLARFARGRVFAVDSWDMLRNVFQAREIDARLTRWPWLAEALLENLPIEGYPPVPGGFLDMDSAWAQALKIVLHLSGETMSRPDLLTVLSWSLDFTRVNRYASLPEKAKNQINDWLGEAMGTSGKLALQCIKAGSASELVALGIVCGVVFHPEADTSHERLAAAVRLEKYCGGFPIVAGDAIHLYRGVQKLLDGLDQASLDRVLENADHLFESLHLANFDSLSDDLPSSFEARLVSLGQAIGEYLDKPDSATAAAVYSAVASASRHRLCSKGALRNLRMEMATKLIRRLEYERQQPPTKPTNVAECVSHYTRDGAFIDWARISLLGGDELPGLTQSYKGLRERIRALREQQNSRFAESLSTWQDTGCSPMMGFIPVENIVAEMVAPLAVKAPVLLLVVDGLSFPIFLEIFEDALNNGWNEILPLDQTKPYAGLATIPSITEISRASLMCGRLCAGQAAQEKTGFASHPALAGVCRGNAKPVAFHKGEIAEGMGLSDAVRDAVGKAERRVVAVVYNGIDDHLSGSDQLQPHWTLDDLRLIRPLLYEARLAGRVIIMTSDHGHVLDEGSVLGGSGVGDRWRSCEASPGPQEKRLQGGRVLAPNGEHQVVVPWSETLRYAQKKNGYHGGISLQEMVVPICMLAAGDAPAGYRLAGPSIPDWWESVAPPVLAGLNWQIARKITASQPKKLKKPAVSNVRQEHLFAFDDETALEVPPPSKHDWIGQVIASSIYQSQKLLAARAALKDEEIRNLLVALSERGGKMTKTALAQRLDMPLLRISGFINAARRLLNVDQVNVLALDEAEGSVTLNKGLLETQFKEGKG